MKHCYIFGALFLMLLGVNASAGTITIQTAEKLAKNFAFSLNSDNTQFGSVTTNAVKTDLIATNGEASYFVIHFKPVGFVIVSAEDATTPVLGYSFDNNIDLNNLPPQLDYWLKNYSDQITYVRENHLVASEDIRSKWDLYLTDKPEITNFPKSKTIAPLLPCNWDQGKYYNELCPKDNGGDAGHVYVGCVATAMAQVMFYYRYPQQGIGTHSYTHPTYGLQSANYGTTIYDWNAMLNQLPTNNLEVARISYQAGVSINMDYGAQGSGANTSSVPGALISHFGYNSSCIFYNRFSFSTVNWLNLIRGDLDLKRPVIYSGFPQGGGTGHCWLLDGYQNTDFYHMNFGWSGGSNGFFYVDNITPQGAGNFNSGHGAVFHTYPGVGYPYQCSGPSVIHTSSGTITDGSGPENYLPNSSCSWLISPDDSVTSIKISFNSIETESSNDIINIYNGATTSDPLVGSYSGSTLPSNLTINNSKVLITFITDSINEGAGFYLTYSSTYPKYCLTDNLTAPSGTITDGSGSRNYQSNTICTWIIQPANAAGLLLKFTEFETEPNVDYVKVYDLNSQALLGNFSGSNLPPDVFSASGAMYIEFRTSGSYNFAGWSANYSTLGVGINENDPLSGVSVFPVPAHNQLSIDFNNQGNETVSLTLSSIDGKIVYKDDTNLFTSKGHKLLDSTKFAKGIYFLTLEMSSSKRTMKVVID